MLERFNWERIQQDLAAKEGLTLEEWRAKQDAEQDRRAEEKRVEDERRERAAAARRRTEWITYYSASVPAEVAESVYDRDEVDTEATRLAKAWLASDKPCLVLSGGVGTGKTVAALVAMREATGLWVPKAGATTGWVDGVLCHFAHRVSPIIRAHKLAAAVDPWKHERDAGIEPYELTDRFLVLDDLGAEMDEARFHQALFAVVDGRQSPRTRTLITTNLRREELRPKYGDRIADRLNAMAKVVQLKGASMRDRGAGL
jgi:DNA replication protein DnaC